MQINATPLVSLPVDTALGPYLRVKMSAGYLALAGIHDEDIGTTNSRVLVSGLGSSSVGTVVTPKAPGSCKMIASEAISAYANVYAAASGKVSDTPSNVYIGIALTAAGANGDELEVLRLPRPLQVPRFVEAHTADDTLTVAESGSVHTSVGASGTVVLTLPAATVGLEYYFRVGAAQELRIDPDGTEVIALPSTGVAGAAGKYLTANADGESVHLVCTKAGTWSVFGFTGTWTAEA